jgi:DNA polymerase (family 10)
MAVTIGRADNRKAANLFYDLALAMEIQGERWRANSYLRAARSIEDLTENLRSVSERGDLRQIEGVGESIEAKVEEYLRTGRIEALEKVRDLLPEDLELLKSIPSLGIRRIADLDILLGIRSVDDLLRAIYESALSQLLDFEEEVERRTLEYLVWRREEAAEVPAPYALRSARKIMDFLRSTPGLGRLELTGPLRRMSPTVANIMILFTSEAPDDVIARFGLCPEVTELLMVDRQQALGRTTSGAVCMIRASNPGTFGLEMMRTTGPDVFVRDMERSLREKGIRIGAQRGMPTEEDIFTALHMAPVRPEIRGMPDCKRVEEEDLKGDLHILSTSFNGGVRVLEMAASAKDLGHRYICFCDRLGGRRMDPDMLEQRNAMIDEAADVLGIDILKGGEVDITPDGRLDYPSGPLEDLDLVIASVNTSLTMDGKHMTSRILMAMEDPVMDVLGHPTSKVVGLRERIQVDIEKVAWTAADAKIALEMSVYPDRMDLDSETMRSIESTPLILFGTEAAFPNELYYWGWVTIAAQRACLPPERVLNTMPVEELMGRKWRK